MVIKTARRDYTYSSMISKAWRLSLTLIVLLAAAGGHDWNIRDEYVPMEQKMHVMSQPEYEHLLHLEGEMIDFCEHVLDLETKLHGAENFHDFNSVKEFLEEARIHSARQMAREAAVLDSPLDMVRALLWLSTKWPPILEKMAESELMQKFTQLADMRKEFLHVIKREANIQKSMVGLIKLMRVYGLTIDALVHGWFGPYHTDPMTVEETMELSQACYTAGYKREARQWLEHSVSRCTLSMTNDNVTSTKKTYYQGLLGTIYLHLNQYQQAKEVYAELTQQDPSNRAYRSSLQLVQNRLDKGGDNSHDLEEEKGTNNALLERTQKFCLGNAAKDKSLEDRLMCQDRFIGFTNETLHVEELNHSPRIVMVYDFFNSNLRNQLIHNTADKLWQIFSGKLSRQYLDNMRNRIILYDVYEHFLKAHTQRMRNITYQDESQWRPDENILSWLKVENFGAGIKTEQYEIEQHRFLTAYDHHKIANYFVFLNEPETGGNLIFPDLKLKIDPVEGAAVLYQFRSTEGVVHKNLRSFFWCPLLNGAQWIGRTTLEHRGQINKLDI